MLVLNSLIKRSSSYYVRLLHFVVLRHLSILCVTVTLFVLSPLSMAEDVLITLEQKSDEAIAIGFTEIHCKKGDTKSASNPGTVLSDDLNFSRRFKVFPAPQFDSSSKKSFLQNQATAYVRGEYSLEGDNFTAQLELMDVNSGELIIGKKYSGKKNDLRRIAHQYADELVYQLFGEKGIAQSKIAYVSKRQGNKEIYLMDYDGENVIEITKNKSINLTPCWIEGKNKILYTTYADGFPQFHLKDLNSGKNGLFLYSKGMNTAANYNKIDKEIVYASTVDGNSEIYRKTLPDGKPTRLTFSGSIDTSPSWSPNGYEIVFISDRSGQPMLYIMDRDGSNVRRITYEGSYFGSPAWSPKGDRIVFSIMDDGNNMNIATITPDGKDMVKLTSGTGSNESPSWSPDARHIVFMSTRTGNPELYLMSTDGSQTKRLSFSGGNSMPVWSDF